MTASTALAAQWAATGGGRDEEPGGGGYGDLPAGTYYVPVTEPGKTESARPALTVLAYGVYGEAQTITGVTFDNLAEKLARLTDTDLDWPHTLVFTGAIPTGTTADGDAWTGWNPDAPGPRAEVRQYVTISPRAPCQAAW